MRIGLAGAGRIGAFHATSVAGLDVVEDLLVADADAARAAQVAGAVGGTALATPRDLIGAGLDGLVVAAATAAHPELILAAVDAGVPAFCEKPVASSLAEAVTVARAVEASVVPTQIGFQRRFDAGYVAARAAVRSGELGRVHTVRATTMDPAPPPLDYIAQSGGIFRDCAVHDFDIVRWVTGREVVEVYATGSSQGDPSFAAAGDVDTAATLLTLDDGTVVLVSSTRYNPRGYAVRLELHGDRDSIAVGLDDRLPLRSVEPGATFPAGPAVGFFMDRFTAAYLAELTAFTEVVAGRAESVCTVADAVETALVADAATLSLHRHRAVSIDVVRRGAAS